MKLITYPLVIIILLLMGCSDNKADAITTINDPELVTIAFFNALYNEKNIDKAVLVCSPRLARIILSYHSSKAVGRHLFNMSYDKVEMKLENSGAKIRKQFTDTAKITVYFDGLNHDQRLKDIKSLSLIKEEGKWLINKILKDPF